MAIKRKYYKLTKDQKERGVIFSSQLNNLSTGHVGILHEVHKDDPKKWEKIDNLKDLSFFKNMARIEGWSAECIERS